MGITHGGSRIAVPQQFLHFIERVPRIDQKRGEGVPQVVNTHIGKSQFPPEFVPEQIEVAEGLSRSTAGKQPRIAWLAWNGANNRYGLVGQRNMARLAGLGQRHGEQALIQTDMFPARFEDFVFACAGQQKQADGKGLLPVAFFQRPHEPLCLIPREVAFPLRVDFERRDSRAWGLSCGQKTTHYGQRADCLEGRQNTVAGGRSQTAGRQSVQPVFHFVTLYVGKFPRSERRG